MWGYSHHIHTKARQHLGETRVSSDLGQIHPRRGADFLLLPSINQSHNNSEDTLITRSPILQGGT